MCCTTKGRNRQVCFQCFSPQVFLILRQLLTRFLFNADGEENVKNKRKRWHLSRFVSRVTIFILKQKKTFSLLPFPKTCNGLVSCPHITTETGEAPAQICHQDQNGFSFWCNCFRSTDLLNENVEKQCCFNWLLQITHHKVLEILLFQKLVKITHNSSSPFFFYYNRIYLHLTSFSSSEKDFVVSGRPYQIC